MKTLTVTAARQNLGNWLKRTLRGRAAQLGLQLLRDGFQAAAFAAQVARTPVHVPQTVQNGSPNAELGIGGKAHLLVGVELVHGVDQAHDTGVQKIVERNVLRQPFVDAACDVFYLRQLFQQELVRHLSNRFTNLLVSLGGSHVSSLSNHFDDCTGSTGDSCREASAESAQISTGLRYSHHQDCCRPPTLEMD